MSLVIVHWRLNSWLDWRFNQNLNIKIFASNMSSLMCYGSCEGTIFLAIMKKLTKDNYCAYLHYQSSWLKLYSKAEAYLITSNNLFIVNEIHLPLPITFCCLSASLISIAGTKQKAAPVRILINYSNIITSSVLLTKNFKKITSKFSLRTCVYK